MAQKHDLPSGPPGPVPSIVHVIVGQGGLIQNSPEKFAIHHVFIRNIVAWVVQNDSGQPITVSIVSFLRKEKPNDRRGRNDDPVDPIDWLVSNSIQVESGQVGVLGGALRSDYHAKGVIDQVSYTIEVRSRANQNPFQDGDWDPDGEIKP